MQFLKYNVLSCLKLQDPELIYLVDNILYSSSYKVVQFIPLGSNLALQKGSKDYIESYKIPQIIF